MRRANYLSMEEQGTSGSGSAGWLVLAVVALAALGTAAFVAARLSDQLVLDYVSILCSSAAAVTLFVAVRGSKRPDNAAA